MIPFSLNNYHQTPIKEQHYNINNIITFYQVKNDFLYMYHVRFHPVLKISIPSPSDVTGRSVLNYKQAHSSHAWIETRNI